MEAKLLKRVVARCQEHADCHAAAICRRGLRRERYPYIQVQGPRAAQDFAPAHGRMDVGAVSSADDSNQAGIPNSRSALCLRRADCALTS
eukprot:scaffold14707_cov129-Isochrysis_galbana.AAC.11